MEIEKGQKKMWYNNTSRVMLRMFIFGAVILVVCDAQLDRHKR